MKARTGASHNVTLRKICSIASRAGAALLARRRLAIERILANVEIEGREIGVEEGRQPRDDALIIELLIGLADLAIEFRELDEA